MYFSKQQREYLGKVSSLVFGSESQWQKRLERGEFDVIERRGPAQDAPRYVTLNNSTKKGSKGTVLRVETAKESGYIGDGQAKETVDRSPPDQQRVLDVMERHLHLTVLYSAKTQGNKDLAGQVDAEERSRFLSAWLTVRDGRPPVRLVLTGPKEQDEAYVESLTALVGSLPEIHRPFAEELIRRLNDTTVREGLAFDALLWLHDLTLCANHPDEAAALYQACCGGVAPRTGKFAD